MRLRRSTHGSLFDALEAGLARLPPGPSSQDCFNLSRLQPYVCTQLGPSYRSRLYAYMESRVPVMRLRRSPHGRLFDAPEAGLVRLPPGLSSQDCFNLSRLQTYVSDQLGPSYRSRLYAYV